MLDFFYNYKLNYFFFFFFKFQIFDFTKVREYVKFLYFQNFVMGMKQLKLQDFLPKARTKASPIFNSNYEIKKQKQKHDMCKMKIQQDLL